MRLLVQRVSAASVEVDAQTVGKIERGLLVFIGITHDDTDADIDYLIKKLVALRIFNDEQGKMNVSVNDVQGGILLVSQFTLYADTIKGNRPSYIMAARPEMAKAIFERFIERLKLIFSGPIQTGIFGADMQVKLTNDGPVTICIDSRAK